MKNDDNFGYHFCKFGKIIQVFIENQLVQKYELSFAWSLEANSLFNYYVFFEVIFLLQLKVWPLLLN